ncbi:MAG: hypothetical protein NVV82_20445 [Sporocytophaga sp.]|nr:hypothetical protein [Sporocytophaga sp.]
MNLVVIIGDLMLPFKNQIHDSYYYPLTLEVAFAYWALGNTDKTLQIIKENINSTINYNNGGVTYKNKVKDYYKNYRSKFQLKNEKEIWEQIKSL